MIEGNTLKFGYGDIATGSFADILTFRPFNPPQKVGTDVRDGNVEWSGNRIVIQLGYDDALQLLVYLRQVSNGERSTFEFANYIFDFSHFDAESVAILISYARRVLDGHVAYMAC